jgi:uncharacterized membrane protein YsdA (DUF1294 family)
MLEAAWGVAYYTVMGVITFTAFGIDKRKAVKRHWRTSETALLSLSLAGGWAGAWLGRRTFRHKTQKRLFTAKLAFATGINVLALAGWLAMDSLPF